MKTKREYFLDDPFYLQRKSGKSDNRGSPDCRVGGQGEEVSF